jgi:hypothetical protein
VCCCRCQLLLLLLLLMTLPVQLLALLWASQDWATNQ